VARKHSGSGPSLSPTFLGSRPSLWLTLLTTVWLASPAAAGALAASGESPPLPDQQTPVQLAREIRAQRLEAPVRLDGILDEGVWQGPSAAPLVQNDPDNGHPPRQRTDWWVAYDDKALYVAARMYDTAPDSIACNLARRDNDHPSDWICVDLGTFNDDRNGYSFRLNPAGAFHDMILYNDDWEDSSWDPIWDYGVKIDGLGWAAEMRIPFSQLDFPNLPEQAWDINLSRRTLRYQERDDLFHIPRGESGYFRRCPSLVGLQNIHPGRGIEVLTYASGKGEFGETDAADPFHDGSDFWGGTGADVKWRMTSDLKLYGTVNPDFGQVEVDPAVVNLSDCETYYDERRPFFVEDANTFRFGEEGTNNNWNFNWMDPMPLYSRRIGRAPSLSMADHDYADVPAATSILGAGKLSGKIGGTQLGLLSAVTSEEQAELDLHGARSRQMAEPLADYSVLRLQRSRADGTRGIGFMGTGTWRRLDDARSQAELTHRALSGGLDGWLTLDEKKVWALKAYASASHVAGSTEAIDAIQRSSRHYLQRPGKEHFDYDPTRTALDGWAGRAMLNKQSGGIRLNTALGAVSPGYEINDLGFQYRSDQINWHLAAGYRWYEPTRTFRSRGFNFGTYRTWDCGGTPDAYGHGFFYDATFTNYWGLWGQIFHNPERNSFRATRGGPVMRVPSSTEFILGISSDSRKAVTADAEGSIWRGADGSGGWWSEVSLEARPGGCCRLSLSPSFSYSGDQAEWVDQVEDPAMTATSGVRYIFGHIKMQALELTTRLDFSFTPRLTLQTYIQPLFAVAEYTELKEFARPHTYDFNRYGVDGGSTIIYDAEDAEYTIDPDGTGPVEAFALADPNFNYKSLKVNLVLRWEFRPGSTIYLVWTQNREDEQDPGDFAFGRDARSLLQASGDDAVMVKITNWWSL
jgi:hypothetical protein